MPDVPPLHTDRPNILSWVDRAFFAEAVFFALGAMAFCVLAVFQKTAMQEDITAVRGYVLPFLFGGGAAALIAYFNRRSRRDLMARLQAQAERDMMQNASVAKSECIANMSHELRTPLNAILGFSGSIQSETFGPLGHDKYREYIDDISHSGQHLLNLINDVLDVSAIEAGKLTLHEDGFKPATIAKDALHVLEHLAHANQVETVLDVPPDLPALYGDERRFRQILLNLLSNAIKFTPSGGTVKFSAALNPQGQHVFNISDTGIGMGPDELSHALTPFGQLDSQLAREHKGTGLGLPLTKGLIDLHDGDLVIRSEKGVGTTVTITFPANRTITTPQFSI